MFLRPCDFSCSINQKGRFVIETERFSETEFLISILDYDWNTGTSLRMNSTFVSNGVKAGDYTKARKFLDNKPILANGDSPQPVKEADDWEGVFKSLTEYLRCLGPLWEGHPTFKLKKEAIKEGIEFAKTIESYKDKADELENLQMGYDFSIKLPSIFDKIPSFKYKKPIGESSLKRLEELCDKFKKSGNVTLSLQLIDAESDFDELVDEKIELTFLVTDANSKKTYIAKPVFFDILLVIPGSELNIFSQTKATNQSTGKINFTIDPLADGRFKDHTNLEARIYLSRIIAIGKIIM